MRGWWSQRFAPEGAASADGIAKQLGQPALDPLTILVREAAQNSWDARHCDHVRFVIELRRLGDDFNAWRNVLLPGPGVEAGLGLGASLMQSAYVLIVSDRGTRGLGGPLRADETPAPGIVPDFVQFLRNVGEASDQARGGGTYGFGKGIFYSLSRSHAILVDTHCRHDVGIPRRLMGAALGHSFSNDAGVRFTGRHWWGVEHEAIPYPLQGADAEITSVRLGLPGFGPDEFGTDIAVLGVDLGEVPDGEGTRARTPLETGQFLVSSILWNLWPKLGSRERIGAMSFSVTVDGRQMPVPLPEDVPELAGFVAALDRLDSRPTATYQRRVEPKVAGHLALCEIPAQLRPEPTPQVVAAAMPVGLPLHHIARMRVPELVVDYVEGATHPDSLIGYTGVFRASDTADRAFAKSEPPTHDDWVANGLSGSDKGVVMNQKRFMTEAINQRFPRTSAGVSVSTEGLGRLAAMLSSLIPASDPLRATEPDSGERRPSQGSSGGGRRSRRARKARLIDGGRVVFTPHGPRIEAPVDIPDGDRRIDVTGTATVVIEGGRIEDDPPVGAKIPRVLGWYDEAGRWSPDEILSVPCTEAGRWTLVVSHEPDIQVRLKVETETVDG